MPRLEKMKHSERFQVESDMRLIFFNLFVKFAKHLLGFFFKKQCFVYATRHGQSGGQHWWRYYLDAVKAKKSVSK